MAKYELNVIEAVEAYADLAGVTTEFAWVRNGGPQPLSFEPENAETYAEANGLSFEEDFIADAKRGAPNLAAPMALRAAPAIKPLPKLTETALLVARCGPDVRLFSLEPGNPLLTSRVTPGGTIDTPSEVYAYLPDGADGNAPGWYKVTPGEWDPVPADPAKLSFTADMLICLYKPLRLLVFRAPGGRRARRAVRQRGRRVEEGVTGDLPARELAERYDADAEDCARWAREARVRRKAAHEADDMAEFEKWAKIARQWGSQAAQLKRDAQALRAGGTDRPPVNSRPNRARAARSTPPKGW